MVDGWILVFGCLGGFYAGLITMGFLTIARDRRARDRVEDYKAEPLARTAPWHQEATYRY